MIIGALRVVLQIPDAASLKIKRHVVRSVVDRLRARFHVAVAEVDEHDAQDRAVIGVAVVGHERPVVEDVLARVLHSVEEGSSEYLLASHELELGSFGELGDDEGLGLHPEKTLAESEGMAPLPRIDEPPPASRPRPAGRPGDRPRGPWNKRG